MYLMRILSNIEYKVNNDLIIHPRSITLPIKFCQNRTKQPIKISHLWNKQPIKLHKRDVI